MFCSLFITSLFGHQTLTGRDDTPATRSFRVDLFSFRFISILLIGRNECVIRFVFCLFFIQSSLASPSTVAHRRSCLMFDTLSPKLNVIVFFFLIFLFGNFVWPVLRLSQSRARHPAHGRRIAALRLRHQRPQPQGLGHQRESHLFFFHHPKISNR